MYVLLTRDLLLTSFQGFFVSLMFSSVSLDLLTHSILTCPQLLAISIISSIMCVLSISGKTRDTLIIIFINSPKTVYLLELTCIIHRYKTVNKHTRVNVPSCLQVWYSITIDKVKLFFVVILCHKCCQVSLKPGILLLKV